MEWYVYRYDFNKREIVPFNVFHRADFKEDVEEIDIKNISYKDINNMPSSIIILFEDDKLLSIKLVSQELSGVFKLSLNEKTEGVYFVGNSKLPLHFFLKRIEQNDLDIEIEYDIYSHEQLLSCNTLEIEVKKC